MEELTNYPKHLIFAFRTACKMEDIQSSTNDFEILNDMDEQEQVSQESQNADEEDSPSSNEQLVGFE